MNIVKRRFPPLVKLVQLLCLKNKGGANQSAESSDTSEKTESIDREEDPVIEVSYKEEKKMIKDQEHIPVGGKLQRFWRAWKAIKASKKVVRWARKGYRLPFIPDGEIQARAFLRFSAPQTLIPSYAADSVKGKALSEMLTTLL